MAPSDEPRGRDGYGPGGEGPGGEGPGGEGPGGEGPAGERPGGEVGSAESGSGPPSLPGPTLLPRPAALPGPIPLLSDDELRRLGRDYSLPVVGGSQHGAPATPSVDPMRAAEVERGRGEPAGEEPPHGPADSPAAEQAKLRGPTPAEARASDVPPKGAEELDPGEPMVRMERVFKAFGANEVVRGVDLVVYPKETVCIIGGSGTGKSVSLKLIMRLLEPDKGRIWLDGEDITSIYGEPLQRARSKLGVNFQFGALLNWLTVFDNVALPLRENTEFSEQEIERRVMDKLELLSIPQARDRFPNQISGGMKKRAGLARAVVMEESVKVILYDEPTSGLDPISTATVDEMINELKARLGLTQIIVTHDMASAYRTADRIAVLHEGRVAQVGTPEEIQSSRVPYVRQFVHGLSTQEALVTRETSRRISISGVHRALREDELEREKDDEQADR